MRLNRAASIFLAAGSAAATWFIYYWVIGYWGGADPAFTASLLLFSAVIHELSHWSLMELNGVRAHIFFATIFGGAIPDRRYADRLAKLGWSNLAAIYLAGVGGNLAIILGTFLLYWPGWLAYGELLKVWNLNGTLILLNLIPIGMLDGGRFAKILFDSIPEKRDKRFAVSIAASFGILVFILSVLSGRLEFWPIIVVYFGLQSQAERDDPAGSENRLAMNKKAQIFWSAVYTLLLCIGAAFFMITPLWMN